MDIYLFLKELVSKWHFSSINKLTMQSTNGMVSILHALSHLWMVASQLSQCLRHELEFKSSFEPRNLGVHGADGSKFWIPMFE